jgi:YonK protein
MAKFNSNFSVTGNLELDMMTITEDSNKDGVKVFDLRKILGKYDGYKVKFSISIETDDSEFLAENQE